ncbi:MAG: regulatory protein RecX [Patescibacteria group bacterium]
MKKSPLQYALDLIAMRDRTVAEIRKKMKEKEFLPEDIEATVQNLIDKKFLDDERFVENFIRSKQLGGKSGIFKIKFKLINLGINKDLIEKYLNDDEEWQYNNARELAENWLEKKQSVEPAKRYGRLGNFLAARGFSLSVIKKVLNELLKS